MNETVEFLEQQESDTIINTWETPTVFNETTGFRASTDELDRNVVWNGGKEVPGHKHVMDWGIGSYKERLHSWTDFVDKIDKESVGKYDLKLSMKDLKLNQDLTLNHNNLPFSLHGLLSLTDNYTEMPRAVVRYFRNKSKKENKKISQLAILINEELAERRQEWKSREIYPNAFLRYRPGKTNPLWNPEGRDECRAMLSDKYTVIDNKPVVDILDRVIESLGGAENVFYTRAYSIGYGDYMRGNFILPDRMKWMEESEWGVGFTISNSEIGHAPLRVSPYLFRALCSNSAIWGFKNSIIQLNKRHSGNVDMENLEISIRDAIIAALSDGESLLHQFEMARDIKVDSVPGIITHLTQKNVGLTKKHSLAWWDSFQSEPQSNAFGVINGLTRAAQHFQGQERDFLETKATELLCNDLSMDKENLQSRWSILDSAGRVIEKNRPNLLKQYVYGKS